MTIIGWIILLCVASCGLVAMAFVRHAVLEVFLGMLIPLVAGIVTIFAVSRIFRRESRKLTAFMVKAFGVKMILYGVSIILIVGVYSFQAVPFIVSFTVYFTGLHIAEALYFRTLFSPK